MSQTSFSEVKRNDPCPICNKPKWCSISADKHFIICRHEVNGAVKIKKDKNGSEYFVHLYPGVDAFPPTKKSSGPKIKMEDVPRAHPDDLHKVNTALLANLTLSEPHKQNLIQRGLVEAEIIRRQYKTLPIMGRQSVAKKLIGELGEELCKTVPGFIKKAPDKDWTLAGAAGILIPVRDVKGRIIALKTRVDKPLNDQRYFYVSSYKYGGPGPGNPVHVPAFFDEVYQGAIVRVTEGELKADVAQVLSGTLTISVAGVQSWQTAFPVLSALDARIVVIAFDKDARGNKNVGACLRAFADAVLKNGYKMEVETWN
jgi:hypothetical protein